MYGRESVNVLFNHHILHQITFASNAILHIFGLPKLENVLNAKIRISTVSIKTDVYALNKHLMSIKKDASDVNNLNIGTLSTKNVKIVPLELISLMIEKYVKLVLHSIPFGMGNTVLNAQSILSLKNKQVSAMVVQKASGSEVMGQNAFLH